MSFRIVKFHINEVVLDCSAVNDGLNDACHRNGNNYRISGVFQADNQVIFNLEEQLGEPLLHYTIAEFMGNNEEDIIADIYSHWQSGISTRGMIDVKGASYGIFEKPLEDLK